MMQLTPKYHYISTDNLGSIVMITNPSKTVISKYYYQPFGGRVLLAGTDITPRGYTFHEHLTLFGLINMNGRMYDPVLARFLSPDPYVQMPDFTQSFNRYAYCMNNPFKYTDPSGEFIVIDSWLVGFFKGLFQKGGGFKTAWTTANNMAMNDIKIWGGLFVTDPNKSFWGRVGEFFSRFTWQLPQTLLGFTFSQISNLGCQVDKVEYKYGATVLSGNFFGQNGSAITLSNYINGSTSLKADPNNSLFQHEYGHYIQSQKMGWAYLSRVGIPSAMSKGVHDFHPVEQDANRRAFLYFNKNVDGFYKSPEDFEKDGNNGVGWNFDSNPLNVDGTGRYNQYIDYRDASSRQLLDVLSISAKWYDYLDPFGFLFAGWINAHYYNKNR
ncbi:hypothetical protein FACS1894178_4010 [Bacteroidia bacterium]|nr:hypothetical protein FACS1894178_4010 [Bacteroidia bacterium]